MSRLATALRHLTDNLSGAELADILDVPKRTADRWLAELRDGNTDNWHAGAIAALAAHEASSWGTRRIADALVPEAQQATVAEHADADRVARLLPAILASHRVNAELLSTMATDLSDGVLQEHEARSLLPLVRQAQAAATDKHRALVHLEQLLINRLRRG
jgi:hypothetical protein